MGNTPELQTHRMPHGRLLVNVPITFPSSFLATDSQSCTAISAATFLAWRKTEQGVSAAEKVTHVPHWRQGKDGVSVQDPHRTRLLPPFCCSAKGSPGARQELTTVPVGKNIPNHRHYPHWGPPSRAQGTREPPLIPHTADPDVPIK